MVTAQHNENNQVADAQRAKGDMAMKDMPAAVNASKVAAQAAAEVCTTPTKTEKK